MGSTGLAASTDPCVHCGFCLPSCASYRVLGTEMDSPRGRIHALKDIEAGELQLDATVAKHFDSCLGCLAAIPSDQTPWSWKDPRAFAWQSAFRSLNSAKPLP